MIFIVYLPLTIVDTLGANINTFLKKLQTDFHAASMNQSALQYTLSFSVFI